MKSMTKQEALAALRGQCVTLIRFDDFETAKAVSHAVAEAGIGALEITFTVKDAPRLIRELNEEFGDSVVVGAGTVMSADQVELAYENGADFITSPCILPEVGAACKRLDLLWRLRRGSSPAWWPRWRPSSSAPCRPRCWTLSARCWSRGSRPT